ncbi:formylglycine-generating enzyme family protein [uncultured Thiodictyon sp.]|uniref:formylglycine-generating enzyme family protein n=1 Tax=uncultured Thiodictyon sp. TaxID=1846217 RepID=UPI0025CB8655|nr:formylglycine-generating enzyme family protein [uncultured Thiodictyon sp.]
MLYISLRLQQPHPCHLRRWLPVLRKMLSPFGIRSLTAVGAILFATLSTYPAGASEPDLLRNVPVPETVSLPAGHLRMGCLAGDPVCHDNEKPLRTLDLAAFEIGTTEVTFAQWDACVAMGGCAYAPADEGWGRGNRPVINVSWDDIQHYLAWLNTETGRHYRLPSEAEWEYAARAGTTTTFNTGDCIAPGQANYSDGADYPDCGAKTGVSVGQTQPVGSYPANPWGLFDLHGNVWEWVQDCWHESYANAPPDGSVWSDSCSASQQRGLRGGSWDSDPHFLRSAFRLRGLTDLRHDGIGFRVARTIGP